jgi:hypothetical protein
VELLRGVPASSLLANFGNAIRVRPDELPDELAALRFNSSRPVKHLQYFLSHCWSSPGWHKFIALLLHFVGGKAFVGGACVSLAILCTQRFFHELPHFSTVHEELFHFSWAVSHWEMLSGLVAAAGILVFGHLPLRRTHVFLDCACIHQTIEAKKMAGIRNLATYLRKSDELVVLWEPCYFTRGWCGYELASYLALNPGGRVRVIPLLISVEIFTMIVFLSCGFSFFLLVWPYIPGFFGFNLSCGLTGAIIAPGVAYCGEKFSKSFATLSRQLDSFDIKVAQVTVQADHQRILEHIDSMYPKGGADAFNIEVRTNVKNLVVREFGTQRSPISYRMAMFSCYPASLFMMSLFSGMRQASIHFQRCVLIYSATFVLFAWPSLLAFTLLLGEWCAKCCPKSAETTVSLRHFGIGAVTTMLSVIGIDLQFYLPCCIASGALKHMGVEPWCGPLVGAGFSLFWLLFCIWLFLPQRFAARRSDAGSDDLEHAADKA